MDANAPSGDAESADLVDLSKEDSSDKGKKRSSTIKFEPSAGMENFPAYQDSSAVVKTTLSSLFGSALMPILTEEAASSY
ncbi:TPA: hypothetical protein ACH3X1_011395 [Trebouxia sp. C0004]